MSPKSAIGPRDSDQPMEPHWLAEDDECGIFAGGPRPFVVKLILDHFSVEHPDINPVVDGIHFRLYEAPYKCDVCGVNAEPPYWDHAASEPIHTSFSVDTDGLWLLCQTCHDIVEKRDSIKLAIRMLKVTEELSPGLLKGDTNVRVLYTELARMFVERLDGGRVSTS